MLFLSPEQRQAAGAATLEALQKAADEAGLPLTGQAGWAWRQLSQLTLMHRRASRAQHPRPVEPAPHPFAACR